MELYGTLTEHYKGWTLTEIRGLSPRERHEWIMRAARR